MYKIKLVFLLRSYRTLLLLILHETFHYVAMRSLAEYDLLRIYEVMDVGSGYGSGTCAWSVV